ncbi:hypothetical protein [Nocardia amamiensis]|uniref:hypothetical protein n=1 Tax=Nocardia amamiensis TaxID=404578 RepID=UPI000B1C28BA|nr:hypothetical protein [Nocardia amamiensis]
MWEWGRAFAEHAAAASWTYTRSVRTEPKYSDPECWSEAADGAGREVRPRPPALLVCVLVLVFGLSAAACSPGPGETGAVPETTAPQARPYQQLLSAADRDAVAYRDSMRQVDPCGYLDEAAVRAIGDPGYWGADGEFESCAAVFGDPVGPKEIDKISVELGGSPEPGYGVPVEVGGTTVRTSPSEDFCSAYVDLNARQSLRFVVWRKGDFLGRAPKVDLCPEAAAVAAAAAGPHLGQRPARSQSRFANMASRLSALDPCKVLDTLAAGHPRLYVGTAPLPWQCDFNFDVADRSGGAHVDFLFDSEVTLEASSMMDEVGSRIDGYPVVEQAGERGTSWADSCQMRVGVDPAWQPPARGDQGRDVDMVRISVENGGCEQARAIATELLRLYKGA